ncbi:lipase member H-B [Pieris rapae]|uniref:lipase member H-B n=1 Tax=Pieris rapae TaxID=64459 RepID=UPI001E27BE27|nr:lipase member H-B [Pieris rapae]
MFVLVAAVTMVVPALALLPPRLLSTTVDELVKAASNTCESLPLDALASGQVIPELKFYEFTQAGKRKYLMSKAHTRGFSPSSQLVIYIPGWWNTPTDESSDALVKALLIKNPTILIIDTRSSFRRGYVSSALQVDGIARRLFIFIQNLHFQGYPISKIHLIGFSLGAHVAGITGRLVQLKLHKSLERITALDPARPCFMTPSKYRLRKEDASFVYVLHTSSGVVGLEEPIGHVDVYVNGITSNQPECKERAITLECDHAMSWKLYAASVKNDSLLIGSECVTWNELKNRQCSGDRTNVGYGCSSQARGLYLYTTQEENRRLKVFNPLDIRTWFHR